MAELICIPCLKATLKERAKQLKPEFLWSDVMYSGTVDAECVYNGESLCLEHLRKCMKLKTK